MWWWADGNKRNEGDYMKSNILFTVIGAIGGYISAIFGGWDSALTTLVIFMGMTIVTGKPLR